MARTDIMTNQDVYDAVSASIKERFFGDAPGAEVGALEMNYFSFCIGAQILSNGVRRGVYVKIPKADLYIEGRSSIMPISEKDRELAQKEYESLIYLDQNWTGKDLRVIFPRPLGFIEEYNAIITERFYAEEIFHIFRNRDLKRRIAASQGSDMMEYLGRLGKALARFHQKGSITCDADISPMLMKIRGLVSRLGSSGADARLMDKVGTKLSSLKADELKTCFTRTLKGLDIRNVFVDRKGMLYLLDPGKMKEDWCEMDLARFLVTCRILYWGSLMFFLRLSPLRVYEEYFLWSYNGGVNIPHALLHLCMIKELLKHWEMAHVVLSLKSWPGYIKQFVKKKYIDPFYRMQINMEIEQIR